MLDRTENSVFDQLEFERQVADGAARIKALRENPELLLAKLGDYDARRVKPSPVEIGNTYENHGHQFNGEDGSAI